MISYEDVFYYANRPKISSVMKKVKQLSRIEKQTLILNFVCEMLKYYSEISLEQQQRFYRLLTFLEEIEVNFSILLNPRIIPLCKEKNEWESRKQFERDLKEKEKTYMRYLYPIVVSKIREATGREARKIISASSVKKDRDAFNLLNEMVEDLEKLEEKKEIEKYHITELIPAKFVSYLENKKTKKAFILVSKYIDANSENFKASLKHLSRSDARKLVSEFIRRGNLLQDEDEIIDKILFPFAVLAKELALIDKLDFLVSDKFDYQRLYREKLLPIVKVRLSLQYQDVHRLKLPVDAQRKIQSYLTGYPENN